MNSQTIPNAKTASAVMLVLALIMLATRAFHVASTFHLPDASWALFFLAGIYLGFASFGILLLEAVAIDVIFLLNGGNDYCFSIAYGFLVFAYLALWFGGYWASRMRRENQPLLLRGLAAWLVASVVAYLLTNGSFYWLSGKAVNPSVEGWLHNAQLWAYGFIVQPMIYLVAAAAAHFIATQINARMPVAE